ncbi:MAG: PolC-type DNA polymerase III [Parasporobacterium sp.]|nr:PolC-type DNA polymerase III [Parasporobacterium sp.]
MKFFEVFPVNVNQDTYEVLSGAEVESVNKVLHGGFLRVRIRCSRIIPVSLIHAAEDAVKTQLLKGMIEIRIENISDYEFASLNEIAAASDMSDPSSVPTAASKTAPRGNGKTSSEPSSRGQFKTKKKGPDEGMLYGRQFKGAPTPIVDILGDMKSVIVSGTIFENELIVTKNGFKIFRFSVTDQSDSISVKLFIREEEEDLPDKLHNGLNILIHGKVEYDNFEGEFLITRILGIKETDLVRETRKDLSPEKRVELHLHTRYSDMDALTNVEAVIDRAVSWGHRAMAITDHGVVQGFPDAFHKMQDLKGKNPDLDFKILYGVEGYLVDDSQNPIVKGEEEIELIRTSSIEDETPSLPDPDMLEAIAKVKKSKYYHVVILAKNETGRRNLYRLVSLSHVNYFQRRPRIPKSLLARYREGLIIGSACVMGEVYDAALSGVSDQELEKIASFYDYLEIQPTGNNEFLIREYQKPNHKGHALKDVEAIRDVNRQICSLGDRMGKLVVATGDVHFLDPDDSIYRSIMEDSMKYEDADRQAPLYFHSTDEMLEEFRYLGEEKAKEIVITNTNAIADMIEYIEPVRPDKCPPVIENSDQKLRDICYETAASMYGDPLPAIVKERLDKELNSIISNGYSVMYIIARELVIKSVSDGYLVGSRGSVGSSLAATMSGITEVNPLPPHYRCRKCRYSDFDSPEVREYAGGSGCDMPDRICPVCGEPLYKDGFDIPFETFLGFKGDKEPDIDLNFSGEYQSHAHDYTEVIFGKGHTFRAGTIATLQDKTVYGYVKGYMERRNRSIRKCEMNRLVKGLVGVKRTTGQHPGGIVVLPHGEEIYSFTPVQHPANDASKNSVTTHFEYHSIDHNLLKLDILGHDDPTMIKMLEDLTDTKATEVRLDHPDVMKLFESTEILGITPEDIAGYKTGTLGIPEFGTDFTIGMLLDTKPKNFSDLVRIAGLSHGTDVWLSNAQTLIEEEKASLSSCICTRDDIMIYLIQKGVDPALSFNIMEAVRKGKVAKGKEKRWPEWQEVLKEHEVPDWYLWSCGKIQYMFPKAHAVAYVMMAYRIAYYKIFYPLAYYAAFFSIRASAFNYELMCQGKETLIDNMNIIKSRIAANEATPKDEDLLKYMYNVMEMYARGFEFMPIDIYKAKATRFQVIDGKLMPSFASIDGIGDTAAILLEEAAKGEPFVSREDLRIRSRLSGKLTDKLYQLGILGEIPESSQMSFTDLFPVK